MADMIVPEGSPVDGVQRYVRYVDNGDGTWSLKVSGTGGGGGGGAATIADGADVTQGNTTDAAVAAGAAGTESAKLRRLTTDVSAGLTLAGAVNETAPASDTASSGHNGRLQRIAQRITSLIAFWYAQGSATAAQVGQLIMGAVTTAAPTYTTGNTNPLSLKTNGDLRTADTDLAALVAADSTQLEWSNVVSVAPTVTNGAYSAGDVVGGILDFADVARANDKGFIITDIVIALKSGVTPNPRIVFFNADPASMVDNAAYALATVADVLKVRGDFSGFTLSDHGTPNVYELRGLSKGMKPYSGARNIKAYLIDTAGVTLTSTSDVQVTVSVIGA